MHKSFSTPIRVTLEANLWKSHSKAFWIPFSTKKSSIFSVSNAIPGFPNFWHIWPLVHLITFIRQINVAKFQFSIFKQERKWRNRIFVLLYQIIQINLKNVKMGVTCRKTWLSAYIQGDPASFRWEGLCLETARVTRKFVKLCLHLG